MSRLSRDGTFSAGPAGDAKLAKVLAAAYEKSTLNKHRSALASFFRFCEKVGIAQGDRLPASEKLIVHWMVDAALAPTTVKQYFSSIRSVHRVLGLPDPGVDTPVVQLALRGLQKLHTKPVRVKLPITVDMIVRMRSFFDFSAHYDRCVYAAICVGVFGMLRSGELVRAESRFGPLRRKHVTLGQGVFSLFIAGSKTDMFGKGHRLQLVATGFAACPVVALSQYVNRAPFTLKSDEPLFMLSADVPLSRAVLVAKLSALVARLGSDPSCYAGHSLRRGGATSYAAAGVSDEIIKSLGRWSSDTYQRYVIVELRAARAAQTAAAALRADAAARLLE
jgi:site-specific recombinase XerD